ncbi:TQXA domain-containing protein [Streptomyces wuyuanensis]|uniref:LPXTG-motif cell wall anchor domain-containing protein/TQXA domain-containing protein n=1 Tax=Streptomyces wuyuanensis TaxID=1196353 RepID=A0A1G9SLV7_9ACTN|nr:TQXA domain-containing protein [Streptomyces wuyuanensis]SDM36493.1 LPXTG-motif cell wall anchor domain-containing protein/TQXA domain-containing protein [Streptomyces wuyuanensis]
MFTALSVRGRGAARLAVTALVSGLFAAGAVASAGPAAAEDIPQHQGGVSATLDGLTTFDRAVLHDGGRQHELPAGLFEMTVDGGGRLKTYCIDVHNPTQEQARYLETPWEQTSLGANSGAGKIRWILQHSYPQVDDLMALAERAGTGPLTERTAAAGTQVAIWRFSDGAEVEALDPAAEQLADWLEKKAKNVEEPRASLSLEPNAVSGKAGGRLGPITVRTDADRVTVTPPADSAASGVIVTDQAGRPVTTAVDGSRLYFDVPAGATDGTAALSLQATTNVPVGRAFSGVTKSQTQILAGSSRSTVSATATATWAKKGPIPALTAKKNCAEGGIDITATNEGDEKFTFELLGREYAIAPGESRTVTVPVPEDRAYDFTITGPGGFSKNFKGVLDCKTTGSTGPVTDEPAPQPSAASAGSTAIDENLAATGASGATPIIAGVAIGLVIVGGAAVLFVRKKKAPSAED